MNLPFQIDRLIPLREHVYIVYTNDFKFVLKGFSSLRRLKIQESFTNSLINAGFDRTYSFYSFAKDPHLFYKSHYYGCIEFIESAKEPFYYDTEDRCQEGLQLLHHFHQTTNKLVGSYQTILPNFDLINKWKERFILFKKNLPIYGFFLRPEILDELMNSAKWSLNGLQREQELMEKLPDVILHGDVAYHNFLRTSKQELFLIDFDLISIGPEAADYLQYANRILPFLNWSLEGLAAFDHFKPYLQKRFFLYALAYPTDIFREWNRLVKDRTYHDSKKVRPVLELTLGQFEQRKAFVKELGSLVKKRNNTKGI